MSGASFIRLKKLKGKSIVLVASRHNKRQIAAEIGVGGSIDASRSGLNVCLHGPQTPEEVAALARSLMAGAGIVKVRKDAVMCVEFVFSLPSSHLICDLDYFKACLRWVEARFGGLKNVLAADAHRDEAAPHLHVLLLPLEGHRMVGSDLVGNRQRLIALQRDFHEAVAAQFGFKKAPQRLSAASKSEALKLVLDRLRVDHDPALRSSVWPMLRGAIEHNPLGFAEALGIEVKAPEKRLRSMTSIFTGKGRGRNVEEPYRV